MSALDIPKLYRTARKQFTVRDDRTGQLLGYALLIPGVLVENVKLVPWLEDDLLVDDPELAVQDKTGAGEDEEVSELDITESSSISSLSNLSKPTAMTHAGQNSLKLQEDETPVINICSEEVVTKCHDLVNNNTINSIKEVKELPHERIDVIDSHVKENAEVQKLNSVTYQDLEEESEFNAWNNVGMYDKFVDVVEESKFDEGGMPRRRKSWRVRCVLCADEKIYYYESMRSHIESVHEPCITCEICGAEFSTRKNLTRHKFRAHKERASDGGSINVRNLSPSKLSSKTIPFNSSKPVIASDQMKRKSNSVGTKQTGEKKQEPSKKTSMNPAASNSDSRILQAYKEEVKTLKNTDNNVHTPDYKELQRSGSNCSNGGNRCSNGEGSFKDGAVRDIKLPAPPPGADKDDDDDLLPVIMISDFDKNIRIKMGLKKDVKVKKAMKKFASRFNADYKKLSFVFEKTETNIEFTLTGNELVDDMKGGCIKVIGIISDHRKKI